MRPVIPTRSDQKRGAAFDKSIYRERNIIERTIGWLKEYQRIATRHEKLGIMYLGMVTIAFISEYLNHCLLDTAECGGIVTVLEDGEEQVSCSTTVTRAARRS